MNDFGKPEAETDLSEIFPVTAEINHSIKNLKKWMKPNSVLLRFLCLGHPVRYMWNRKAPLLLFHRGIIRLI